MGSMLAKKGKQFLAAANGRVSRKRVKDGSGESKAYTLGIAALLRPDMITLVCAGLASGG